MDVYLIVTNIKTNQKYTHVTKYHAEKLSHVPMSFIDMVLKHQVSTNVIGDWKFEYEPEV